MHAPLTNIDLIRQVVTDAIDRCIKHEGKLHLRPRWPDGSLEPDVTAALARSLEHVMRSDKYRVPAFVLVTPEFRWRGDEEKIFKNVMDCASVINAARRVIREGGRLRFRPDIIVHERGPQGPNYFVIELKMSTNRSRAQAAFDRLKLQLMTTPGRGYEYHLGFELQAQRALAEGDRRIRIVSQWQNGACQPP